MSWIRQIVCGKDKYLIVCLFSNAFWFQSFFSWMHFLFKNNFDKIFLLSEKNDWNRNALKNQQTIKNIFLLFLCTHKHIYIYTFSMRTHTYVYIHIIIYIYIFINIYIYSHLQTDRFVISQLLSVARHDGFPKLGSIPATLKRQSKILPLSHEETSANEGNLNAYVSHFFLYIYLLHGYREFNSFESLALR